MELKMFLVWLLIPDLTTGR